MKTATLPTAKQMPRQFDELVRMFPPRAIHDDADYDNMQEVLDRLMMIPKHTKGQAEYVDTLIVLFSAYEQEHYAIDTSDITPLDSLKSIMADHKMGVTDLATLLGCHKSTASLIASGKRGLSKAHIKTLAARFKVSADLFL